MGEEKNLSETDLISRESGAQFESLPEMTLTTRLILGECQMEIAEILKPVSYTHLRAHETS